MKIQKKYSLNECDGGCCGDAGGSVGGDAGGAIGTCDCIGDCSQTGHSNGFFGPGCFHVPELCNGGSIRRRGKNGKKKKYRFEYGAKVITTYDQLVSEEEKNGIEFDYVSIPRGKFMSLIRDSRVINSRYNQFQFEKYLKYGSGEEEFVALQDINTNQILAAAVLIYGITGDDDCHIAEIQCLRYGFGAILLKKILQYTENTWLMADIKAGNKLANFYRRPEFGLAELKLNRSIFNAPTRFFISKNSDPYAMKNIKKFIFKTYSNLSSDIKNQRLKTARYGE